ncbi:hypothetical protein [Parerythrobacter aestuarii]|uniref:hypothetical protein n=1 Tax=Parerythrobacter aestuarii TaxID=3020909 RepID=UPI0024DEC815|nr:hypothetical protein [Parerythrobacter aestuarii]
MTMAQLTTPAALEAAAWGGALGAVGALGFYAVRDRAVLLERWQHWRSLQRGELVPPFQPSEPDDYVEFPVTEEERRRLPFVTAWFAFVGACFGLWSSSGSEWPMVALAIAAPVRELFAAIWRPAPDVIDTLAIEREPPPSLGKRLFAALGAIAAIGLAVAVSLGTDVFGDFDPGIEAGQVFRFFWIAAFLAALGAWLRRQRTGPPQGADEFELEEWHKETAIALIVAVALGFVGTIAWLA